MIQLIYIYIHTYIYIYWDLFSKKIWIISLSSWRESNLGVIPGDTIMIIPLYEVLWYYDIQMTVSWYSAKAFPAVLQSSCKKKVTSTFHQQSLITHYTPTLARPYGHYTWALDKTETLTITTEVGDHCLATGHSVPTQDVEALGKEHKIQCRKWRLF